MYKLVSQHLQRQHLQVIFHLFRLGFPVHTIWLEEIFRLPLLSSPLYQTINYIQQTDYVKLQKPKMKL